MELVSLEDEVYVPRYNPDTGIYEDETPFCKYSRKNQRYECRCRVGSFFTTYSQFSMHCKTKTHRRFIATYEKYYKESDKAREEIKGLMVENERLKRRLQKYEGIIQIRDLEITFLNGIGHSEEASDGTEIDVFEDAIQYRPSP